MTMITRIEARELAGEDGEQMVRGIAKTASVLVSQKEVNVGEVMETIGGTLRALHMDGDRMRTYAR